VNDPITISPNYDPLQDTLLTTEEVCEFLRISRKTLYRLVKNNEFPQHYFFADEYRFPGQSVRLFLEAKNRGISLDFLAAQLNKKEQEIQQPKRKRGRPPGKRERDL
jgi:excisionase family DNA binding protein